MEKDTTADEKAKLADLQKKLAVYQQSIKKNKIPKEYPNKEILYVSKKIPCTRIALI